MGCPFEAFGIDGVMDVIENPCFSCPSKVVLFQMSLINMDADDFETY